ncbi:MAG TPA: tetratricopeptide repeat protein [Ktedonobacteraceae bacterium]|nr:tetratricopeptide repeat protein [Ktedonobacteraceae bacterium]
MKTNRREQLEGLLANARQIAGEYEHKILLETDAAQKDGLLAEHKKTQQRIAEFEELLGAYSPAASRASGPHVAQAPLPSPGEPVQEKTMPPALQLLETERVHVALERLALPHWFSDSMLPILLSDILSDQREQTSLLDQLMLFRQIEIMPASKQYRVPERLRTNALKNWQKHDKRTEFTRLSALLADYCAEQVRVNNSVNQNEWRCEQLYHLAVCDPQQAMQLLKIWFDESVEEQFDFNQAYCWLLQLDERRELLAEIESTITPPATWTTELSRLHEYLTARAFWTDEWLRTIHYQQRDDLTHRLEAFFNNTGPDAPWLLNLYAQGGYGKTATIQWLLARYLLPQGFVCARFDYDNLSPGERIEVFQQPDKILKWLSENLNAQRLHKIEAFQRQSELRSDPVGHFTLVLREMYGDKQVILFIDTLEVLLENNNLPEPDNALIELLNVLSLIHNGDLLFGGTTPGHANLRVVLSGRQRLHARYATALHQAFPATATGQANKATLFPLIELEVRGFTLAEARKYLSQKRKLPDQSTEQIITALQKAASSRPTEITAPSLTNEIEVVPLKLAQYADLLKEDPTIDSASLFEANDIDMAYLVNRILKRVQKPAIHWLLRYAVIFRRLDASAAQVLMPFLEQALAGHKELDDPDFDPPMVSAALEKSRQQTYQPVEAINQLFNQLIRYSWVDHQGNYIKIHPEVSKPQLRVVAQQKIFKVLQQAAFEHYADLVERCEDPQQKADYLREAIFHVLQMDDKGIHLWREQLTRYRYGPGLMLWTLVDETFLQVGSPWPGTLLSDTDRSHAYLDLANLLLTDKEQPFLEDPLAVAEDVAQKAFNIASKGGKANSFLNYLVRARIALARHKLPEALETAIQCVSAANTLEQSVEALVLRGSAEAANSRWEKALDTLLRAYTLIKTVAKQEWFPAVLDAVYQLVQFELIDHLLNSPKWQEAIPLLAEARRQHPQDPVVLKKAARMAFKQARLQEAVDLYQQAIALSSETQAAQLLTEQQRVQFYQGKSIPITPTPNTATWQEVFAPAQLADWLSIENMLGSQMANLTGASSLETLNTLLQYYLEVMGDWRQVRSLQERGARWAAKLPETDPAVARFDVLRQYIDFLSNPPVLTPDAAQQEYKRRLQQIAALQTPEARVRAKGYLLLVRFYGGIEVEQAGTKEREAIRVYTWCAIEALKHTFDLLTQLAPLDQVDVMRTLAVLPAWSCVLINDIALDPGERSPLLLLAKCFHHASSEENVLFLSRLAKIGHFNLAAKLDTLREQIMSSDSDWPLLYTSFARLLAASGQPQEAQQFLREAPFVRGLQTPLIQALIAQDQAFITSWKEANHVLTEAIALLEHVPEAKNYLINELLLIRAYLALDKGTTEDQWRIVFEQPIFSSSNSNTRLLQDLFTLQAVSNIKLGDFAEAQDALKKAADIASQLGNIYAINVIRAAQNQLQATQQSRPRENSFLHLEMFTIEPAGFIEEQKSGTNAASKAPLLYSKNSQGLELSLQQVNETTVEVVLTGLQQQARQFKTHTHLEGIKHLLPRGVSLRTLPDLDYWQKLLNADSNQGRGLEQIGATLLNDLLPLGEAERNLLDYSLQEENQSLRLIIQGTELERLPWGILYDIQTQRWLADHFRLSYNRPSLEPPSFSGRAIAVLSTFNRQQTIDYTFKQIQQLYGHSNYSSFIDSRDFLGRDGPSTSAKLPTGSLFEQIKLLHLVGDFSELNDAEGVFLNMGRLDVFEQVERLTPDYLARRLRHLGISNAVIVLEPLSTGSTFEDVRVLMLRNSYAAALARLGPWTVLAIGPEHGSTTTKLIEQLLHEATLTTDLLENIIYQPRTEPSFNRLLEGQFELFYPTLLLL